MKCTTNVLMRIIFREIFLYQTWNLSTGIREILKEFVWDLNFSWQLTSEKPYREDGGRGSLRNEGAVLPFYQGITSHRTVNLNFQILVPSISLFIRYVLSDFYHPLQAEWYHKSFQLMGHKGCSEQPISLVLTFSFWRTENCNAVSSAMKWRSSWDSVRFSAPFIRQI